MGSIVEQSIEMAFSYTASGSLRIQGSIAKSTPRRTFKYFTVCASGATIPPKPPDAAALSDVRRAQQLQHHVLGMHAWLQLAAQFHAADTRVLTAHQARYPGV